MSYCIQKNPTFQRYLKFVILEHFAHAHACVTTPKHNDMDNFLLPWLPDCISFLEILQFKRYCNLIRQEHFTLVSSRVGIPPFWGNPTFWAPPSSWNKFKKLLPSFWEPSKLVHINCMKHFKMKVLRFVLSSLRTSLSLLFVFSGSTLYLLLTLASAKYCLYVFRDMQEEWTWNISKH